MKNLLHQIASGLKAWAMRLRVKRCERQAAKSVSRVKLEFPLCEGAMNTATWPPVSGTTTGYVSKGKTTIQWGTDGLLSSPFPASGGGFFVVERARIAPVQERILLENGTGIPTSDIMLTKGARWELTVRDDSGMTPPTTNSAITVVDGGGLIGTVGQVYAARVIEPDWETGLKQAATRVLGIENMLLIDSQTAAAQTAR